MTPLIDDEIRRLIDADIGAAAATTTLEQLGYDSLGAVELCIKIEDGFALPARLWRGDERTEQTTVGQIIADTRDVLEAKAAGK